MQFILRKSGWFPAMAFALLLISLLIVMAQGSPPAKEGVQQAGEAKASYSLALPTIMAPVIRKEVRKEAPAEVAYNNGNSGSSQHLPSLFSLLLTLP